MAHIRRRILVASRAPTSQRSLAPFKGALSQRFPHRTRSAKPPCICDNKSPSSLSTYVFSSLRVTDSLPTFLPEQPPHAPEARPNIEPAVSPTSQRRLRPLPLPPGAPLPPIPSPTDLHEVPQGLPNTSRPGTAGVDGCVDYGPLLHHSHASIFSRRQLPQAPGPQSPPGFIGSRSTGSATSPTSGKPIMSPQSDIAPNIYRDKPVPAVPTHLNGDSPGVDDIRDQLSRKPSTRPPGALAPTIPGLNGRFDDKLLLDMYATEDPLKRRPSHQQLSGQSRYPRIPEPAILTQLRLQDADVGLGRATSTGSTTSSARTDLLGRNPSATTTATTYSDYQAPKDGSSALARDNSVGSYGFPSVGASTVGYPETLDGSVNGYSIRGPSTESFDRSRPSGYGVAGSSGGALADQDDEDDGYFTDSDDPDPDRFVNFSLLSHLAVRLRDKVPRGVHVKSSIPYPRAFTGKDIVVCGYAFGVYRSDDDDPFKVDDPITNSTRTTD